MNIILKKPDTYTLIFTLIVIFLIFSTLWQFYPNLLTNPGWLKTHDAAFKVSVTQDVQTQILQAGAQQGQLQTLLQLRDAAASGKTINISVADPSDKKTYNFTLQAVPTQPTSTPTTVRKL